MINSSWGLGEAIVSGMVTPDEFIVDKRNMKVIEQNPGTKNNMVVQNTKAMSGTEVVDISTYLGIDKVKKLSLKPEEIRELVEAALKIENHYGRPQDIEWAYTDRLYILQARPITTLKPRKKSLKPLVKGLSASPGIGKGKVKIINDMEKIKRGKRRRYISYSNDKPGYGTGYEEGGSSSY